MVSNRVHIAIKYSIKQYKPKKKKKAMMAIIRTKVSFESFLTFGHAIACVSDAGSIKLLRHMSRDGFSPF